MDLHLIGKHGMNLLQETGIGKDQKWEKILIKILKLVFWLAQELII